MSGEDKLFDIPKHTISKKIIDFDQFTSIWRVLPKYVKIRKPILIYESAEDGYNI